MDDQIEVISLFGVNIHDFSNQTLEDKLIQGLNGETPIIIFTPNPEFLLSARSDFHFRNVLNKANFCLPDGIGLRFAVVALTTKRIQHRQTGIDTFVLIARLCASMNKRLLLLGGTKKTAEKTAHVLLERFPKILVQAINPGFIKTDLYTCLSDDLVKKINDMRPEVIAVALGQKKQELLILEIAKKIPTVRILIGVGGAFDILSGKRPRAPIWMRRAGFEWLWRVLIEPKRANRILRASFVFPLIVFWSTIKRRQIVPAFARVVRELYLHFKNL